MKQHKIFTVLTVLLALVAGMGQAVAQNVLRVADFTQAAGKEAYVPIYLDNSTDIVGLQFNIQLPYAKSSSNAVLVDERSDGHSLSLRKLSDTRYTIVVMSMQNRPLRGNGGLLIRFPINVPATAQADDELEVSLTDIVLTDRTGHNVTTATEQQATFTVMRTPKADFVPTNLTIHGSDATLQPGSKLQVQFSVLNQGDGDSEDGWSEKVYLEDLTGTRTLVGTQRYGNTLAAGEQISRLYELDIPQAMHIDGTVHAVVEVVALKSTEELIADQGNNTTVSSNTKELERRIFLSTARLVLKEGNSQRVTLTRSGDWTMSETFSLAETNDHGVMMLSLPATVTIPAKSASVNFNVAAPDNTDVNTEYRTGVTVSGDDYEDATMIVDVEDDDSYALTLTTDKYLYDEGEELTLTVTINKSTDTDLKVNIANTDAGRFYPYVRSITIPAGQLSAQATTTAVDDNYPMADASIIFTAQATGYTTSKQTITIRDDDWPTLSLNFSRNIISEGDGYGASMGTVTRKGNTNENLTVYLNYQAKNIPRDANRKELYFDSQYVIIPAGQTTVTFQVGVEDNSVITTPRIWTVTAAACDASTGRPVSTGHQSYTTADLTVTDDDAEGALKLQCNTATLTEGGGKAIVTITRNSKLGDLVVTLKGDPASIELPASVTIPDGKSSATFEVSAKSNPDAEDNYYARVTASAPNSQDAQFVFMVSTLPDAVCTLEPLTNAEPYSGETVDVVLNVTNQGTSTLQAGMEVRFYLIDGPTFSWGMLGNKQLAADIRRATLTHDVAAGQTVPMTFSIKMPEEGKTQPYWMIAWLNPMQETAESNKDNNRSGTQPVNIRPAFSLASISTDKHSYTRGEVIHISGQMSNADSQLPMAGRQVDVYLLNDTKRYQVTTTLNADGSFEADYTFGEQTGGRYKVGACVHGSGGTETGATINVARLSINRNSYLMLDVNDGVPVEGDITVTNLSEEPLYNITYRFDGLPDDWTVETTHVDKLDGGATANCHYRFVPTEPDINRTSSGNYKMVEATFIVSSQDSEGTAIANSEMPVYCKWRHTNCNIVAADVKTTLYRNGSRTLNLLIENTGLKETGNISVAYSSGQEWLTVPTAQLASIASDGYSYLQLNLTGNAQMIVDGTYEATLRLTPENGQKKDINVKCTVVSTDIGTLLVDVVDAYTLGADDGDGPHVSGASVRLTNALTGEVAMTGTTGDDGIFKTDILKEGTYYVYVTAPNHYYAEKTITIDPGVENQMEVFLNYETVKITYTVERTSVQDEYKTVLIMDVVPDIPQAIVVPDLPDNWGTGSHAYTVRLTNKGRLTAYTPYMEFPQVDGYSFKVISDYPAVIYPNESFDVSVEFNGPETATNTLQGCIRMNYAYKLKGETHWSSETYLALMGSDELIMLPGGGLPDAEADIEGQNFGRYKDTRSGSFGLGESFNFTDEVGASTEPEFEIRDYTKSIDNRIRLQFEQTFTLEREAFQGSLKVENLQMSAIEDVTLVPTVKTLDGQDATDLFAISTEKAEGWSGDDDRWNLESTATGTAKALYVPSKETAPTVPVDYLFGGTVSYRNVSDGQVVVVELTPTQLTVNPSPDLHLTYFVQRDFISDDPLTDEVEAWEPAQFALLIQNRGAGEALNLSIETNDPTVVDNACNLPVKFTKLYCTVDGQSSNMNFNKVDLGNIAAGQNVMARWWFYSNVMAHVANYEARMTKHSTFGREFDLITLDGVRELTRSVSGTLTKGVAARRKAKNELTSEEMQSNIMLLNLIADDQNLPDHVMDLNGNETDDLEIVSDNISFTSGSNADEYVMTVKASREGWVYGIVHDPTNCTMKLVKVVRQSDGADVTANVWQTERTVTANYSTIVDNRLHMADNIGTSETYTLTYEPKPAAAPAVKSIELLTDEGKDESEATRAKITFAEPVEESSVTADDLGMSVNGKAYELTVVSKTSTEVVVDWSDCASQSGNAVLTAFTTGITNSEGRAGLTNKSITWVAKALFTIGDVNGDGEINLTDASWIVRHFVGRTPEGFNTLAADADGNGLVNMSDAMKVVRIYVGKERTNN